MAPRDPRTELGTHEVINQPPEFPDYDAYASDAALREAVARRGAGEHEQRIGSLGRAVGSRYWMHQGELANRYPPVLHAFDRYGRRLDEVEYHPAYHELMRLGCEHGIHCHAWQAERGGHVAHLAMLYLLYQAEGGVCCPLTMTHAVVPALRAEPEVAAEWQPRLLREAYDPRFLPAAEKRAVTFGMAMTEKQGGSDVRASTTRAEPLGGAEYLLTGHKWFCSAPMSDAFLTLAQSEAGLTCFLVSRFRPDGSRNPFYIQRLKDKLGNRANASSEIEYRETWARRLGPEGRGVRTIIEMVQQTRLDAALAPVALMRQAWLRAWHHTAHRQAFGRTLSEQPLMRNVLADLALEVEAGLQLMLRLAEASEQAASDSHCAGLSRVGTAIAKYWLNKRAPGFTYEAMECLGGSGYVEESILPRLYREAPVNSIWEGSGNVLCLDVLRAMQREPESLQAVLAEIEGRRGEDVQLDRALARVKWLLGDRDQLELRARALVEQLALCLQAAVLLESAPPALAQAFCATRLGESGRTYGMLSSPTAVEAALERAAPGW